MCVDGHLGPGSTEASGRGGLPPGRLFVVVSSAYEETGGEAEHRTPRVGIRRVLEA